MGITNHRHKKQNAVVLQRWQHHCFGVFTLLLCLIFSACEKEEYDPRAETPLRTVLCYMGGDNNLSYEVSEKLEQIQKACIDPNCRLLVYQDAKDALPCLSEITTNNSGTNSVTVIHEYDENNSADAEVFGSVLREVKERYPSPSYGLVLFSHATGWLPEGTYNNPTLRSGDISLRSVVLDGSAEMEIPAFAAAIPDGMLDFLIFEACYMASVEVAYELKDKTKYIVASSAEIVSPGFTHCYTEALPLLYQPQADLAGFCRTVEANYKTRQGDYSSLTLSLIQTDKLDALAATVCELSLPVGKAGIQAFDRKGGNLFFDLEDAYTNVAGQQTATLETSIGNSVEWETSTAAFMPTYGGFDVRAHCGLTTYIPQEQYPKLNEAWKGLKWYGAITKHHVN